MKPYILLNNIILNNMTTEIPDKSEIAKEYQISAKYKKATYEEEHWFNNINGKKVELHVTSYYRWGTFTINLTDSQKEQILKKENIVLNDYDYEFGEMWDGDSRDVEIQNEDQYTEEELKNINDTLYEDEDEIF